MDTVGLYGGYDKVEAELYDFEYSSAGVLVNRPGLYQGVEFFVAQSKEAGGETLELGCGTGRVLIPTAAAGCSITGLDFSPFMLKKCAENLQTQPAETRHRTQLIRGDMTRFELDKKFSLVTIPFRLFQHLLTVAEQKACLNSIKRHLAQGGRLVFDVFNPRLPRLYDAKYQVEVEDMPEMSLPDGRRFRRTNRVVAFHHDEQYNDLEIIRYIDYPDGRSERQVWSFPMRYYFRYELEHLLELSGFRVAALFGDFDKSHYTGESPEMIFVTELMEQ
jgi:SAM-dependent methyltransferase